MLLSISPIWQSKLSIREVMNKLDEKGYQVVSTAGIGQTFVATMYKAEK